MNKIPTAEEFFYPNVHKSRLRNTGISKKGCEELMIKFAKLHVEAVIKECIECAPSSSSTDTVSYEDVKFALKDCYPLDNIK